MKTISAKTILSGYRTSDVGDQWFGYNYNMNLYKGCNHGCIYCDSRSECYHVENFDEVRVKENALQILEKELHSKQKKGRVGIGAMSDSYNLLEREYKVTRGSLELLAENGFGAGFSTKSDLVVRDKDVLLEIKKYAPVDAKLTITAYDDGLSKTIEPGASVTSRRLEALGILADAGITTGVLMMPILPFIEDQEENIINIVKASHECGVKFIYPGFGVTLRQNQRDYYFERLDELYPGLKEKYIKQYQNQYSCNAPNAKELKAVFAKECYKYHIAYQMKDIIAIIEKGYGFEQLSLF